MEKVIKTTVWEPLFELVYLLTIIEKLYLIAEVEHSKQTFRFKYLIANIFLFLNKPFLWLMFTQETRLFLREDQLS